MGVLVKTSTIALIGIGALALYAFKKSSNGSNDWSSSGGAYGDVPNALGENTPSTPSSNALRAPYEAVTMTPNGALKSTPITSASQGVAFINSELASGNRLTSAGATLVPQNTTFSVGSNTYKTGSAQTVSRLADGSIKVLSVNTPSRDSSGKTAWDRRIEANKKKAGLR